MGSRICRRERTTRWLPVLLIALAGPVATHGAEAEAPEAPPQDNAAVLAVLETKPATPAEWVEAAQVLTQLGRPDLGKKFLQQLIAAKPTEKKLVELVDRFGSALFVDLASREELLPEAKTVAEAVLGAATRAHQDAAWLKKQIAQLKDPSPDVRYRAMLGLRDAGQAAVLALIDTLADPKKADLHSRARAALGEIGPEATGPLIAAIDASQAELAAQAIRVLARMEARPAAVFLLKPYATPGTDPAVRWLAAATLKREFGSVPGERQALELLVERASSYFYGEEAVRPDADGLVEIWRWDAKQGKPVAGRYTPKDAARFLAARLARDAHALAPEDPQVLRLYLIAMLEQAACEKGRDKPLEPGKDTAVDQAEECGAAALEDVLEHAIASGHLAAATAVARALGRIGTPDQLRDGTARPTPLVRAMRHSDRRLRLAAAEAVLQLDPKEPFPGSSYVVPALAFFAGSTAQPRALLAGPRNDTTRQLAGELARQRYEVDVATTGRELLDLAAESPDYELALVDPTIGQPTAYLALQRLRHNEFSADLRVGLIARDGHLGRARQLAERDTLTLAFSRPHDDQSVAWQIGQLGELAPRTFVPHKQRQKQAGVALDLLVKLSRGEEAPFDLRRAEAALLRILYVPQRSAQAAELLATINSARSQRALVDLASRWTLPLDTRKAATAAFSESVRRHGILLTSEEILLQYERYNQSENLDRTTQVILGAILDAIEPPPAPPAEKEPEKDLEVKAPAAD